MQRNAHSSAIDALVLSGLRPTFAAAEVDPELGIAHCLTSETLDEALAATPDAVAAWIVSPTYFGAVADVRALAEVAHARGVALVVDEAWGAHLAFHEELPEHALALGADLVISSTHKIVGSLTQSAMLHLGHGAAGLIEEDAVDRAVTLTESTSPNSLLCGSLDAARRQAAVNGRALLSETMRLRGVRARADPRDRRSRRARRAARGPAGRVRATTRCASRWTCAASPRAATSSRRCCARSTTSTSSCSPRTCSWRCSAWPTAARPRRRVSSRRCATAAARVGLDPGGAHASFAAPPPWGELAMTPREAYLGPQEVVAAPEAVGRIAAESLATYPPGIPNVLPGERLTAETLEFVKRTLRAGGSVRGASDRLLRTVRVVAEGP